MKEQRGSEAESTVEVARNVLKDTLRRGPVSFDEIGRRLGHVRGYMSRALRGANPLTLETIIGSLKVAGIEPADYFAAVAKVLTPPEKEDEGPNEAQIEETVLRTLRRLGWLAGPGRVEEAPVRRRAREWVRSAAASSPRVASNPFSTTSARSFLSRASGRAAKRLRHTPEAASLVEARLRSRRNAFRLNIL